MTDTVQKIALTIAARGAAQGWKPGTKTADNLNIEAWTGACIGLQAANSPDFEAVLGIVSMIIQVRGYRETLAIAERAKVAPLPAGSPVPDVLPPHEVPHLNRVA